MWENSYLPATGWQEGSIRIWTGRSDAGQTNSIRLVINLCCTASLDDKCLPDMYVYVRIHMSPSNDGYSLDTYLCFIGKERHGFSGTVWDTACRNTEHRL